MHLAVALRPPVTIQKVHGESTLKSVLWVQYNQKLLLYQYYILIERKVKYSKTDNQPAKSFGDVCLNLWGLRIRANWYDPLNYL